MSGLRPTLIYMDEVEVEWPKCGRERTPGGKVVCDLPLGHKEPHTGRDRAGRWHTWPRKKPAP